MAFLVCLPMAGAIATFFDKKIEEGIPVAMFIATFVTYLCGILGILTVSPYVVGAMALAGLGVSVWGIIKKGAFRNFLTFGGIMYVILGAYYAFAARGRMVGEQDDLQVYAKYVSDFYHAGKIYRFDYIPGMMMWEYLSESFWKVFSDSVLFLAVAMLCVGMMLAIFSYKEKKSVFHYAFVALFIVLFPLSIKIREVYFVLQNDFVMGVTMAYIMCMYMKARKYEDKFYEYASYLGFAFLTLSKVTGMILAVIMIVMLFGVDVVAEARKVSTKSLAYILKCLGAVLVAKFSWTIFVRMNGLYERFSNFLYKTMDFFRTRWYLGIIGIIAIILLILALKWITENGYNAIYAVVLLSGALGVFVFTYAIMPADIRNDAIKNYCNVFFSTYAPDRSFGLGYRFWVPYAVVLLVLMFIWMIMSVNTLYKDIDNRARDIVVFLNVGLVLFASFLFLSNYLTRNLSQAGRAKECERYILAYIVFYVLVCVYQFTIFDKINDKIYKIVLAFFSGIILMISNVAGLVTQVQAQDDYYNYDGLNFVDITETDVFWCIDEEGKADYSRFNYNISPGFLINNYYNDLRLDYLILGEGAKERYMTVEEFKNMLRSCTYVYVASTNEDFERDYGSVFEDEIVDGRIYYVDKSEDTVVLHSIEY